MYESFYSLREDPFSIRPDPAFLLLTRQYQRALSVLQYGLEARTGFTVVTGAIGAGKTTLIRRLFQLINEEHTTGLVSNTQCESFEELLQWILLAFGLEYGGKSKVELYHSFTDFLVNECVAERNVVLIIDEAQHLDPRSLEQLRMLSNVNTDKEDLLQLVLVGQPDLRDLLSSPELTQFAQRITADFHLGPLNAEETARYVRHRVSVVGGDPELFSDEALQLVWEATGGVPRLINVLCGMALVYGFADERETIDADLLRDVVNDKKSGLSPIGKRNEAETPKAKPKSRPRKTSKAAKTTKAAPVAPKPRLDERGGSAIHVQPPEADAVLDKDVGELTVTEDGNPVGAYLLQKQSMTIGRHPDNDISIENPAVSAYHARILTRGDRSYLYDLNSTSGTFVNSKAIKHKKLEHGDVITIAKYFLQYATTDAVEEAEQAESAAAAEPVAESEQQALPPTVNADDVIDVVAPNAAFVDAAESADAGEPAPSGNGASAGPIGGATEIYRAPGTAVELPDGGATEIYVAAESAGPSSGDETAIYTPAEATADLGDEPASQTAEAVDSSPPGNGAGATETEPEGVAESQADSENNREKIKRNAIEVLLQDHDGEYLRKGRLNARKMARHLEPMVGLSIGGICRHLRNLEEAEEVIHPMAK